MLLTKERESFFPFFNLFSISVEKSLESVSSFGIWFVRLQSPKQTNKNVEFGYHHEILYLRFLSTRLNYKSCVWLFVANQ